LTITKAEFERFTAFKSLEIGFSPGINVLIGENGIGKIHILKAVYSACDVAGKDADFAEKLANVFLPTQRNLGRLLHRQIRRNRGSITMHRGNNSIRAAFSTIKGTVRDAIVEGVEESRKKTTRVRLYSS
jgi:recombinational DNA repair ATPase RecF